MGDNGHKGLGERHTSGYIVTKEMHSNLKMSLWGQVSVGHTAFLLETSLASSAGHYVCTPFKMPAKAPFSNIPPGPSQVPLFFRLQSLRNSRANGSSSLHRTEPGSEQAAFRVLRELGVNEQQRLFSAGFQLQVPHKPPPSSPRHC